METAADLALIIPGNDLRLLGLPTAEKPRFRHRVQQPSGRVMRIKATELCSIHMRGPASTRRSLHVAHQLVALDIGCFPIFSDKVEKLRIEEAVIQLRIIVYTIPGKIPAKYRIHEHVPGWFQPFDICSSGGRYNFFWRREILRQD